MNIQPLHIDAAELRKLLGTSSGDAALLYLYIRSGNDPQTACTQLSFTSTRYSCAAATLRQLGLWPEENRSTIAPGERPQYSEKDVLEAMDQQASFRLLRCCLQITGRNAASLEFIHRVHKARQKLRPCFHRGIGFQLAVEALGRSSHSHHPLRLG